MEPTYLESSDVVFVIIPLALSGLMWVLRKILPEEGEGKTIKP